MEKKKIILLTSIILTLLLTVIGGTYAWFQANVTNNANNKDITVTTGKLGIKYTNGNEINGNNILPGWSETKTFTVENTGESEAYYKIVWANLENTFVNKSDLTYKLTSTNSGGSLEETIIPVSGSGIEIITNVSIPASITQTYTITVTYKNREADQNSDKGSKLIGKIEVSDINAPTNPKLAEDLINNYTTYGLSKIDHPATTSQNYATSSYRYTGATPNNYITFNNELWRIIGVVEVENASGKREKRVKIIRNESLGNYSWDSSSGINNGYGVNAWQQADIMATLNTGAYYNRKNGTCFNNSNNSTTACNFSSTGLTPEAKNLIEDTKYYLGGTPTNNYAQYPSGDSYNHERGTNLKGCSSGTYCNDTVERLTTWTGSIALMYPSDYGYAADSSCYSTNLYNYDGGCQNKDWLYNSSINQWTLSPYVSSSNSSFVLLVYSSGTVYDDYAFSANGVRPVTHLKEGVTLISGTGTVSDPFQISI